MHGDLWTHNVMFEQVEGQPGPRLCALIDWQTAFQGNPLFDLAFLLASSADAALRRRLEGPLVDLYYTTLDQALASHGMRPRFGRAEAHRLYGLCLLQVAPVLGALLSFFGQSAARNGATRSDLRPIVDRTRAVLQDAAALLPQFLL